MHVDIVKRCGAEAVWPRTRVNIRSALPPLVITSDQVDWALDEIGATLRYEFS
jgi:adenosylmethionine-8-amino-7-oxononanoate aminotransferase